MGHPDLSIDVSQMPPLLESQQISSLHNQSVMHIFAVLALCSVTHSLLVILKPRKSVIYYWSQQQQQPQQQQLFRGLVNL